MNQSNTNRDSLLARVAQVLKVRGESEALEYAAASSRGDMKGNPIRAVRFAEYGCQSMPIDHSRKYKAGFFVDEEGGLGIVAYNDIGFLCGSGGAWRFRLDGPVETIYKMGS